MKTNIKVRVQKDYLKTIAVTDLFFVMLGFANPFFFVIGFPVFLWSFFSISKIKRFRITVNEDNITVRKSSGKEYSFDVSDIVHIRWKTITKGRTDLEWITIRTASRHFSIDSKMAGFDQMSEYLSDKVNTDKVTYTKKILISKGRVLFAFFLILIIFGCTRLGTKKYKTQERYEKADGIILYEIPENAKDCRFAIYKFVLIKNYLYSFELDQNFFEEYIAGIVEHYELNVDDSDKQYGYRKWYGMKVGDCNDPDYTLDDFPVNIQFDAVIDDAIEDYEVILYSPYGSSSNSYAIVVNRNTNRVVVYYSKAYR